MRKLDFSRILFQLLALGLFVYQLQNSILKYLSGPIVQQTSTTTLDKIQKPSIYVCQEGQFNFTEAKNIGYESVYKFSMGNLIDSDYYTWNGRYGNISYHEIQDTIYNTGYTNILVVNSNGDLSDYNLADTEKVYFAPLGFCLFIEPTKKFTSVNKIHEKSVLYLLDPLVNNKLGVFGTNFDKISFGPTNVAGYYEGKDFQIEVNIHDLSIQDGKACLDYERMGTSYDSCVLNEMKLFLLEWFKCLPPWFPENNTLTCEEGKVMEINDENSRIINQFKKFINGQGMDILKPCLPPCVTMHFKLYEVRHMTGNIDGAFVQVKIKDEIKVNKDVYAYDIFSLVVDLGSSLGLWLGLSALSIFDNLIEFYKTTKRKYYH